MQAVVFDFDYTLADATRGIVECFHHALRTCGYPLNDVATIKRTVGMTLYNSFAELTGETDENRINDLRKCFSARADQVMTQGTQFLQGACELLNWLSENGIKTGIVTSKNRYRLEEFFSLHGNKLDVIVGFEDVTSHKPDPEGLLMAIDRIGVQKENVLYVGDSTIDARTAQAAGVVFCGVTSGATTADELSQYPHRWILSSMSELHELLEHRM